MQGHGVRLGLQPTLLLLAWGPQHSPGLSQPQLSSPTTARGQSLQARWEVGWGQAWSASHRARPAPGRGCIRGGLMREHRDGGTCRAAGSAHSIPCSPQRHTQAAAASWTPSTRDLQRPFCGLDMSFHLKPSRRISWSCRCPPRWREHSPAPLRRAIQVPPSWGQPPPTRRNS